MTTNVKSVRVAATGIARPVRTRVKGVYITHGASAGSVTLRDGGAGGAVELQLDTVASNTYPTYLRLPGDGILFDTDVHVTLGTGVTSVTLFYT